MASPTAVPSIDPAAGPQGDREAQRTVCVTGGAGFIGSHLVEALAARGDRVLVVDDLSTGLASNLDAVADRPEVTIHQVDIRSTEAADLVASSGVDVLVHQAAQMNVRRSVTDPAFDAEVNVIGSLNLLEAARRGGVRQVLFASTGGAIYGEQDDFPCDEDHPQRPVSPYGVAKLAVESYLYYYHQQYGLDVTCLRYANVYGERQNPLGEAGVVAIFVSKLLAGEAPTINGDGLQTRDYVHVSYCVDANLAALGRPGFHVYNVGTGRETSVVEIYEQVARALGVEAKPTYGPAKPGEQRRSVIDPARLQRELGLGPPLDMAAGFDRTARWFRDQLLPA